LQQQRAELLELHIVWRVLETLAQKCEPAKANACRPLTFIGRQEF